MRKLLLESLIQFPITEPAPSPDDADLAALAQGLGAAARRRLGRSLAIREVDAGSCNGCELEIHALNNAFYDIERFGLRFVASPAPCRRLARHGTGSQEHARGAGAHLYGDTGSEVGGGGGKLRRRLWGFRRQLCLRRRGFLRHTRKSHHPRVSTDPTGPAQGPDRAPRSARCGADGKLRPS